MVWKHEQQSHISNLVTLLRGITHLFDLIKNDYTLTLTKTAARFLITFEKVVLK